MSVELLTHIRDYVSGMDADQSPVTADEVASLVESVKELPTEVPVTESRPRPWVALAVAAAVIAIVASLPLVFGVFSDSEVTPATQPSTTQPPTTSTTAAPPTTTIEAQPTLVTDLPSALEVGWYVLTDSPSYRQEMTVTTDGEVVVAGTSVSGVNAEGDLVTLYQGFDCLDEQNNAYLNSQRPGYGDDCSGEPVENPRLATAERSTDGGGLSYWDAPSGQVGMIANVQVGVPLAWRCDTTVPLGSDGQCTLMIEPLSGTWMDVDIPVDDFYLFANGHWLRVDNTLVVYQQDMNSGSEPQWWISHDGGATFANTPEPIARDRFADTAPFVHDGGFHSIRWTSEPGSLPTLWTLQDDMWVYTADITGLPPESQLCRDPDCQLEPAAVGTVDGSVVLVLATDDQQGSYLRSADGGRTWLEQEPFLPFAQPGIVSEANGWVVIQFDVEGDRPIVVTDGSDWYRLDGETWRTTRTVAEGVTQPHPVPPQS